MLGDVDPRKRPEYDVRVGVRVPCAESGCRRIITNYAIRKDATDRRVWCRDHAYRARERRC